MYLLFIKNLKKKLKYLKNLNLIFIIITRSSYNEMVFKSSSPILTPTIYIIFGTLKSNIILIRFLI